MRDCNQTKASDKRYLILISRTVDAKCSAPPSDKSASPQRQELSDQLTSFILSAYARLDPREELKTKN